MYITKFFIGTLLVSLCATSAFPDTPAPVEVEEKSAWDALSTTLTVGYDSRYVLYGYRLSRHLWHADIWLSYPLNDKLTLGGGSWYGYLPDGTYEEVDGAASMDYALVGNVYIGLQYSIFGYLKAPWGSGQAHELAAHISYWGENLSLSLRNQYDNEAEGSLTRILAGYSIPFLEKFALKIDAETGYAFGYYIGDRNAWNHAQIKASLPFQMSSRYTLTPFIAYTLPLAAIDEFEEQETYYGLSVSASF